MLCYDITLTITAACISDLCYTLSGVPARFNATVVEFYKDKIIWMQM